MSKSNLLGGVVDTIRKFMCKLHGMVNDHNYSPVLYVLYEQKNFDQITDQEVINLLWVMLDEFHNLLECSNLFPKRIKEWMDKARPNANKGTQTDSSIEMNDSKLVQITCDNQEFDRRVNSFIKRKRVEADTFNRREFCKMYDSPNVITCARADAVFVPRQSKKSLLKIRRVYNVLDNKVAEPIQLDGLKNIPPLHPSTILPFYRLPTDLKERLENLHSYIGENKCLHEYTNVYDEIRELEARVLHLESLSPEYFHTNDLRSSKTFKDVNQEQNFEQNVGDNRSSKANFVLLDERINDLRNKLLNKARM